MTDPHPASPDEPTDNGTPTTEAPDLDLIAEAIDLLAAAADSIDALAGIDDLELPEATHLHAAIVALRKRVQAVEDYTTRHIAKTAPRGPVVIPGVGLLRVRSGTARRNWHTADLVHDIIDTRLAATEGELPDPWTAARWVLDAANIGYFRTTALTELGLDPDDYSERVTGRPSVQIQ